ncbi:MAG: hypothetical protein ABIK99_05395 [candidate division WOR-3 bacterium]
MARTKSKQKRKRFLIRLKWKRRKKKKEARENLSPEPASLPREEENLSPSDELKEGSKEEGGLSSPLA